MKVPDKVYVKKEKNNVVYSLSVQYNNGGEEYIRKDTLIKWLKGNLQEACDEEGVPFEYYENGIITGKISAFEQVINKLNSM